MSFLKQLQEKSKTQISQEGVISDIKNFLLGRKETQVKDFNINTPKTFKEGSEVSLTITERVYTYFDFNKGEDPILKFIEVIPKLEAISKITREIDKVINKESPKLIALAKTLKKEMDTVLAGRNIRDVDWDDIEPVYDEMNEYLQELNKRNVSVIKDIVSTNIYNTFFISSKDKKKMSYTLPSLEKYLSAIKDIEAFKKQYGNEIKDWNKKYNPESIAGVSELLKIGSGFGDDDEWTNNIYYAGFFGELYDISQVGLDIVDVLDTLIPNLIKALGINLNKTSTESNKTELHPVAKFVLKILLKAVYKKYLANPVRELYYSKMRYQRCTEEALDKTMRKLKGINNTAIVEGFEVKQVPGKTFTNTFIVNDKQLKTEDDIYKGIDVVVKEVSQLSDIVTVIHKNAKSIKLNNDDSEEVVTNKVFELIDKAVPKNIFQQFLPTKQPEDLKTIGGCNNHDRIKSKLINAIRPDLLNAFKDLKDFQEDKDIPENIRKGLGDVLGKIIDRYFTFMADIIEWMYRSMRRQTKKSPVATEALVYYYGLEEAEKEELEYDSENAVVEDEGVDETSETEEGSSEETAENVDDTTEPSDEETEGTSDEGTEETTKPESDDEKSDTPEVELDNPDEEKQRIKDYLLPLVGEGINGLTLYSAAEVNRPLYHVSMNPHIKAFYPKVSKRTLSKEDRSIPRISTSTSLIGCLNGYQSMVSDMDGRETKNFNGLFKVYDLPYQYAIKPSKGLLIDVDNSDEYWLISWKKETYATLPNVAADFTIPKIETVYGNDGKDYTYHCYLRVYTHLYLDHQKKLSPGYYHVVLNGYNFKYPLTNNNLIQAHEISETEYNKVVALSMMVKSR